MTYSMTAFARVQGEFNSTQLCWEIRSVNHRYLELSFRLPEAFRFLETELRTIARSVIGRGKLECQLKIAEQAATGQQLIINEPLLAALVQSAETIAGRYHLANDVSVNTLLQWPGMIEVAGTNQEEIAAAVIKQFQGALEQLQQVRVREGQALQQHIAKRLTLLQNEIDNAHATAAKQTGQVQDKLLTRLHELAVNVDSARIEQEIALILTRLDVTEELDRLNTHVQEVAQTIQSKEAVGRRLDFLMQELNREANTLSSKSDTVELTRHAVEMKVLIEQMREQIQNIE
ncbi:YicC/YloC family endoribonuclease [Legionella dresdenensis]|uniref:YicC/YloC family endoribonuclease n=1 Tax=Legionella dresdenensis TaxID=450200 RepID=A0ABV8CDT9_9GAMM